MATGKQILERMQPINIVQMSGTILAENAQAVIELNKKQLLAGKNNQGENLPTYESDPWFKKPGAWQRYADWKKKLFPMTPHGFANFTIINVYHNSITFKVSNTSTRFDASASFAASIASKTDNRALGLNAQSKGVAFTEIVRRPLIKQVSDLTGFKST